MPIKSTCLSEYESACGLQRGQLMACLTPEEQQQLRQLGYRPKCKLTKGALAYLMEIFPLPDHQTQLVTLSVYEQQCGFGRGDILKLLSEQQRQKLCELGYRKFNVLPYRAIVYLRSQHFY